MHRLSRIGALAVAAACSSSNPPPSPAAPPAAVTSTSTGMDIRVGEAATDKGMEIFESPGKVWSATLATYRLLAIRAEVSDSAGGAVGTRRFVESRVGRRDTKDLVRCGYEGAGPSAVAGWRIRLTILSTVRRGDGSAVLTTEVKGTAEPVEGTSTRTVLCASTGELERQIESLVATQLRGAAR